MACHGIERGKKSIKKFLKDTAIEQVIFFSFIVLEIKPGDSYQLSHHW